MNQTTDQTEAVRVVRKIAVPAEKVYDAFLEPEQLARWWGPLGPEATRVEADPRIGGATDIWAGNDEGEERHYHWEIAEMDPPKRLVFNFAFGGVGGDDLTSERSRLTLEFREDGSDSTELILVHDHLGAAHPVTNVNKGWATVTDRLVKYLEETEGEAR